MQVAITGATGFVGSSIIKGLESQFLFKVLPSQRLADESFIKEALVETPTLIHLAGISSVGDCEKSIYEAYKTNVGLSCYLAEVFFRQNKGGHFVFASTGQIYDESAPVPHNEVTQLAPGNLYARSKLSAEIALMAIARQMKGRLTILRMYNHTHKSQSPRFVLPSILKQIQDSPSKLVRLKVGNIDIDRDFSAIQDLISAFQLLLKDTQDLPCIEVYNLSSGVGKNLRQLILGLAQRFDKEIEFEVDPSRLRLHEPKQVIGDSAKFQARFAWRSRSQSIKEFLDLFLEE